MGKPLPVTPRDYVLFRYFNTDCEDVDFKVVTYIFFLADVSSWLETSAVLYYIQLDKFTSACLTSHSTQSNAHQLSV